MTKSSDPRFLAVAIAVATLCIIFPVATAEMEKPATLVLPPPGSDPCAGTQKPDTCPVRCLRADVVCGVDGKHYWCGCPEAACAGVEVAHINFCEHSSSAPFLGQALLLVHIVWLFALAFFMVFGLL